MRKLLAWAAMVLALLGTAPALATVTSPTVTVTDTATGSSNVFNYGFLIPFQADGVTPAVTVQTVVAGVTTTLTSAQYTITGVGSASGGTVTVTGSLLASGAQVIITRAYAYTQATSVPNTGFYPHTVETTADSLEYQIQQLNYGLSTVNGQVASGPVASFNGRSGAVTLNGSDVTGALGYTPVNSKGRIINAVDYGAICNGNTANATADTTGINAALTAAGNNGGGLVQLPAGWCEINATVNVPAGVTLVGQGIDWSVGLQSSVINLNPMISLNGGGSGVQNLFINANAAGQNTTGVVIQTNQSQNTVLVRDVQISGACGGINISGNYYRVEDVYINATNVASGSGCYASQFGYWDGANGSNDGIIRNLINLSSTTASTAADWCMKISDGGGDYIYGMENYGCKVGTYIWPGVAGGSAGNQNIVWLFIENSVLGDTSQQQSLYINTINSNNYIYHLNFNNVWSSSAGNGSQDIIVKNDGGGTITGLKFSQLRSIGLGGGTETGNNIEFDAGTELAITNGSIICGFSNDGILLGSGVSKVTITDSKVGGNCTHSSFVENSAAAIAFNNNTGVVVTGNDLTVGAGASTSGAPTGDSVFRDNIGMNSTTPTIASAASITTPTLGTTFDISGTTNITNIGPAWANRHLVFMNTSAGLNFNIGGTAGTVMCSSVNVPNAFTTITADFDQAAACWHIK